MDPQDAKEQSFTIQVLGRNYHLKADSKTVCKDWVITLNRIKEAKMQQGHIQLVNPFDRNGVSSEDAVTPRVVVVANRGRTRAVAETVDFDQLIIVPDNGNNNTNSNTEEGYEASYNHRRSTIGNAVLARWTKRRSSLSRLSAKLSRWARSLKKYRCTDESAVVGERPKEPMNDPRLAGWINKEASRSAATAVIKPELRGRSLSAASEDEGRYIS